METTFNNLIAGYLDSNGLFTPLTDLELANGKEDLPKDVKLVIRGDVKRGPFDYAGDGITDLNSDKLADDVNDATSSQYLIPDAAALSKNVHYYIRKAPSLVGGVPTSMIKEDGSVYPDPVITVATKDPGNVASLSLVARTMPSYWYLIFQPAGNSTLLEAGIFLEIGINPRLPYIVRSASIKTLGGLEFAVEQP